MIYQGFVGPTYTLESRTFDCQRSINLYPILSEIDTSKSPSALISIPGYELFCEVGGGPIRSGMTASRGRAFAISGAQLYEINTDGSGTLRGTLLTSTGTVSMDENGTQLMMVDGTYGYILDMDTNIFTQITDVNFPACTTVTFQDGYFIVNRNGTTEFYISALYDGFSWDALDFGRADSNHDNLVAVISDNALLWLFGELSVEVFQDTGNSAFPFELIPGSVNQIGCAAYATIGSLDNSIFWLGVDQLGRGVVWRSMGLEVKRVSNQSIEDIIAGAATLAGSFAYCYHEKGHAFYCLNVFGLDTTLCFDVTTNMWHERQYRDLITNMDTQHRASCHFFFNQLNLIGDINSGKIFRQSQDIYDYDGEYMRRIRIAPHISDEKRNVFYHNFELDVETGVGLTAGQGSDPQIVMQYSNDGGRTYGSERWVTIGALGRYRTRVRWNKCGSARDRVFKVSYSEPTQFQINQAYINNA